VTPVPGLGGMSASDVVAGLVTGAVGLAYFTYGKKRQRNILMWSGVALMVYPYFVTSLLAVVAIGAALAAVPFFYRD
jgi:hypothetical protein